jgi:hypothetical protein
MDREENTVFLCCCGIVAFVSIGVPIIVVSHSSRGKSLFVELFISNGFSIFAYFAVVASQRVYMSQYYSEN